MKLLYHVIMKLATIIGMIDRTYDDNINLGRQFGLDLFS